MLSTSDKATRISRHRNEELFNEQGSTLPVLQLLSLKRRKATRTSKAPSQSNLAISRIRIDANNNSVSPPLDDWPASRHVTSTGNMCYLLPAQVKQATAKLDRNSILDVCGGRILTTPRVWRSSELLGGLGCLQGMRWSPIGAFWPVVHVGDCGDGNGGAVSWTTRERSSA